MIKLIVGIVLIVGSAVVGFKASGPAPAIPLLFLGGCLALLGLFDLRGGAFKALTGLAELGTRACPKCAGRTPVRSPICRYCGHKFE